MKDKRSNRYKTAAWILLIAGIVSFSVINIFSLFFHYSNRIHNEILNRNMEQISLLSDYIVKIIRSEMRHCTEILNIGEENFSVPEKMTSAEIVKQLQEIRSRAGFAQIGIMDQEGNTIDDTGDRWQIDDSELLAAMEKGRAYVSDVFTSGRQDTSQIMIMVPLWELQKQKRGWVLEIFMKERTGRFIRRRNRGGTDIILQSKTAEDPIGQA